MFQKRLVTLGGGCGPWPPAAPPPRSGRARAAAAWPINVRGMQCEVLKIVALRAPQSTILRELKATVDSTP